MALLFADSCGDYGAGPATRGWNGTLWSSVAGAGRGNPASYGMRENYGGASNNTYTSWVSASDTYIIGIAYTSPQVSGKYIWQLGGATGIHAQLRINSGYVAFYGAGPTLLQTGTTQIFANNYNHFEVKLNLSNTGAYEVRLNGVFEMSGTGDILSGATPTASSLYLEHLFSDVNQHTVDDIIICDNTGTSCNDFLGDCRVHVSFPNANGTTSNLTGQDSNSTDNYLNVDETTPDDDTTYNESLNVGDKDSYGFTDVPSATGTVHAVKILPYAKKSDAGTRTFRSFARLSGTEDESGDKTLSTSYQYFQEVHDEKPTGGPWSITDVNNAEFGFKITN